MSECLSCDTRRQILCLDCYRRVDDVRMPPTYAEYVQRAAGYAASRRRRTPLGLALTAFLAAACVFAASTATETDERVRREVAGLYAKTRVINESFEQLRASRECAKSAFTSDFAEKVERAAGGEQTAVCGTVAQSWP
jgi:hypothetical protein